MTYVAPQFRCFSAEQHARLIELFGVHDREAHALLFDLLRDISSLHSRWRDMPPAVDEPIESHRKRLTGISKSARYLARELGREPLLYSLLLEDLCAGDQAHFRAAIHEADRWEEDVAHVLGGIARAADRLAKDPGALRLARFDPEAPNVARKEIWEPVLALLRELKIPIGFSKTGPVVEIINIIHEALSLEVPRLESVRTAIKEFKEGAARKRRGARTSKKIRRAPRDAS